MKAFSVPIWSVVRVTGLYGVMLAAALAYFAGHAGRMPGTVGEFSGVAVGAALFLATLLLLGMARASARD